MKKITEKRKIQPSLVTVHIEYAKSILVLLESHYCQIPHIRFDCVHQIANSQLGGLNLFK